MSTSDVLLLIIDIPHDPHLHKAVVTWHFLRITKGPMLMVLSSTDKTRLIASKCFWLTDNRLLLEDYHSEEKAGFVLNIHHGRVIILVAASANEYSDGLYLCNGANDSSNSIPSS
ncbi:hypothetical protein Tco_0858574 [Tanacetum coccineum]|uniref:Ig-like domain-containing protein n=1 Tax=Tanacetum coccineum TaxID=301880 RepID=A0ABQ5BCT5_9ASTR